MTTLLRYPLIFTNRGTYKDDISLRGSIPREKLHVNQGIYKDDISLHGSIPCENCTILIRQISYFCIKFPTLRVCVN